MDDDDLEKYVVVRVIDEIVIDLLLSACGIQYEEAAEEIERIEIEGVAVPFASAELLLRMKQTGCAKDAMDCVFLKERLRGLYEA